MPSGRPGMHSSYCELSTRPADRHNDDGNFGYRLRL